MIGQSWCCADLRTDLIACKGGEGIGGTRCKVRGHSQNKTAGRVDTAVLIGCLV
ncbi:MAG: hypothetical protein ACI4AW_05085 [Paludibacteraceae bacterium]